MSLKLGIFCLKVRRHAQALLKAGLCKVLSCPYAPQLCLKLSLDKISTRSNTSLLLRLSRCQAVSCSHNSSSAAADQGGSQLSLAANWWPGLGWQQQQLIPLHCRLAGCNEGRIKRVELCKFRGWLTFDQERIRLDVVVILFLHFLFPAYSTVWLQ